LNAVTAPTFRYDIFIAGDLSEAKRVCARYCFEEGLCVTVEPTTYVYTGGREEGVRIGLINYPRFPIADDVLGETARRLADTLLEALDQHSFTIVGPKETIWCSRRQ